MALCCWTGKKFQRSSEEGRDCGLPAREGVCNALEGQKKCHFCWEYTIQTVEVQELRKVKRRLRAVVEYSDTTEVVDKSQFWSNQLSSDKEEMEKYYQRVFFHHFNQIIWNSYIPYCKNGELWNHLHVRIELAELVIQKHPFRGWDFKARMSRD
jgi:hypothetical protein